MTLRDLPDLRELRELGQHLAGDVVLPDAEGWAVARQAWNLAVDQRPVAVVRPETADDVATTVRVAARHGIRIAFNAGGHNAGPLDWTADTILLKTERMREVTVDAPARRARVGAGVLASELAAAAHEHGLAYLAGTSPDVGVVGYALGGGLSWLGRAHGLCCNSIVGADVVLADGRTLHTDRDTEPELFWALRGGSGNVAAVTSLEFELLPVAEVYAGALFFPIERAAEVLRAWRSWIDGVPETCESLGRMLQLPDVPFLPEDLRGRSFALVEAAFLGPVDEAETLLRPLRDLGPAMDTMRVMPAPELSTVNMDPDFPLPYSGEGVLLDDCPAEAIDRLVAVFPGSPLLHVEIRHLGGAIARRSPDHGVLDAIDQPFVAFTFGLAPDEAARGAVDRAVASVMEAFGPWDSGRRYLNFAESRVDPLTIFPPGSYARFRAAKARYDPTGLFQANHSVAERDLARGTAAAQ